MTQSQLRKMVEDTAQLTKELGIQRREASDARSQCEKLMEVHTQYRDQQSRRCQAALDEKISKLDETEARLRDVSKHRDEKSRLYDQLKERVADSQTAYSHLKDEVLDLRAQLIAFRNSNNLERRTLDVEDAISSETMFKQDRDWPSQTTNGSQGQNERVAVFSTPADGNVFDVANDQRLNEPSATRDYVPDSHQTSPLAESWSISESQDSYEAFGQVDATEVPQSDQYARSESSSVTTRKPAKPKLSFAEVVTRGFKPRVSTKRQVYGQRRTTEKSTASIGRRSP